MEFLQYRACRPWTCCKPIYTTHVA